MLIEISLPCLLLFLLFQSSHKIKDEIALHNSCVLPDFTPVHQLFITKCRDVPSSSTPIQLAKYFHIVLAAGALINKCCIVSCIWPSQHQHLDTMLMCILLRLSSVGILPFQTFQQKKFILKGIPLTHTYSSPCICLFFVMIISQVDLTENVPEELPIHQYLSPPPSSVLGGFKSLKIYCTISSSDRYVLNFCLIHCPCRTKSLTSTSSSKVLLFSM